MSSHRNDTLKARKQLGYMTNEFSLEGSSIVFQVVNNSPGMFGPDFFTHLRVFPEGTEPEQYVKIRPLVQLQYPGGYTFESTEERTKLEIKYEQPRLIDAVPDDLIATIALKLIRQVPFLDFRALGINFRAYKTGDDINSLVHTNRIAAEAQAQLVKVSIPFFSFTSNVTIGLGEHKLAGRVIVVDANYHIEVQRSERVDLLSKAVDRRLQCLDHFSQLLTSAEV